MTSGRTRACVRLALVLTTLSLVPLGAQAQADRDLNEWDRGNLGLALGEMVLANTVTWVAMEFALPWKDLTRASPSTWITNITKGPTWDDNKFAINWWSHPWGGSHYFNAGRSNGMNFEKSFLMTILGSALWECCGESHRASLSDLVTTTLGGAALGEVFYRVGSQFYNHDPGFLQWRRIFPGLLAPSRTLTRRVLNRPRLTPSPEPWFTPSTSGLSIVSGLNTSIRDGWTTQLGQPGGFLEFVYSYGDPDELRVGSRPYEHFVAALEFNQFANRRFFTRVQIRGNLWTLEAQRDRWQNLLTFYQGFDYLNIGWIEPRPGEQQPLLEFGMQSLGLATSWQRETGSDWNVHGGFEAHVGFGGVDSEYAFLGELEDTVGQERFREYDFTLGSGIGAHVGLESTHLRATGYWRWDRLGVLHGSNIGNFSSDHTVTQLGVMVLSPRLISALFGWGQDLGIGVDYKVHARVSNFDNPDFDQFHPDEYRQFRAFLALNLGRKRRLFPL